MTLRQSLHDYLRDTVDVSVHEGKLPIRPVMPALVQHFVAASTVQTHSNRRSLIPRRVQLDVYGNNDKDVDATATKLLLALDGYHGPMGDTTIGWATMLTDMDFPPTEIKGGEVRFRRTLDFEVAYQERGKLVVPSSSS